MCLQYRPHEMYGARFNELPWFPVASFPGLGMRLAMSTLSGRTGHFRSFGKLRMNMDRLAVVGKVH